jgi:hypothetical protein
MHREDGCRARIFEGNILQHGSGALNRLFRGLKDKIHRSISVNATNEPARGSATPSELEFPVADTQGRSGASLFSSYARGSEDKPGSTLG